MDNYRRPCQIWCSSSKYFAGKIRFNPSGICERDDTCYLKVIHGEAYLGHSGGNYAFESRINFSVQSENGYCVLINTDNIDPLIGKIQDYFFRPA